MSNQEKKYLIDNLMLMAEWNWEKNNELGLNPSTLSLGSGKKVWWKCKRGHEWQATINHRNHGTSCPICSSKKLLKGFNDLATLNPDLANEWNYDKNVLLSPADIMPNSDKKVWWICEKGHEWQASVSHRNKGRGCPICVNKKTLKGYNDLATTNPKLANEWNYDKNDDLKPHDFTANSHRKVWWICKKGHEWQATIASRNAGTGCPYCANKNVLKGYNDLLTTNPKLASEWNYRKNKSLTPTDVTQSCNKKVWWVCKKGHEWQATVSHRNNGRGCPVCRSERHTSLPEYAIIFYLKKHKIDFIHSYKDNGYELDIFIPTKNIAIEYDGYFYHKNKVKLDIEKNTKCKNDGIILYRLREGLPLLNDYSIDFFIDKNLKNLSKVLKHVLHKITGTNIDVDFKKDNIEIENLREYTEKSNSLLSVNPELAKEWNYKRNGSLYPEHVTAGSNKKVWWICEKGHEWQTTIASRNAGAGCPYCAGQKAIKGFNDLATKNPELASEWNYKKNGDLTPQDFTANSGKKVWWVCKHGHEWQAIIASRNKGRGCPYCHNKKKQQLFNIKKG